MHATPVQVVIDRDSPVPLYHQLAEQLTEAINSGVLQPGDPFENEMALADRLKLSRPTVRQAISTMVDQGLLVRRRGLGTRVANRKVHRKARLSSLFDDLVEAGQKPRSQIIVHQVTTDEAAAAALDVPADTELLSCRRLRFSGDFPLAVMHNWLPAEFAISEVELIEGGLYQALRNRGIKPVMARQTIGARMPTASERRLLDLRGAVPVLTMTRVAFDTNGRAVDYGTHCYRSDSYTVDLVVDER